MRSIYIRSVFFACLVAIGSAVLAISASGSTLSGTVSDSSGKVIPGASVTATNVTSTTETDKAGLYVIPNLVPGVPFTVLIGGDPLGQNSVDPYGYPNRLTGPGCNSPMNPGNPHAYIKLYCFGLPTAPASYIGQRVDFPGGSQRAPMGQIYCANLLGNESRNSLIGPGLTDFDMSFFKNNPIRRISDTFPVGSIKKGQALVMTGEGGKTIRCANCHGADLMGMNPVPGIAGRSPSYLVRQLYDMQHGFRTGEWTTQMKPVVAKLSAGDMLAIAAYLASLSVPSAPATTAPN